MSQEEYSGKAASENVSPADVSGLEDVLADFCKEDTVTESEFPKRISIEELFPEGEVFSETPVPLPEEEPEIPKTESEPAPIPCGMGSGVEESAVEEPSPDEPAEALEETAVELEINTEGSEIAGIPEDPAPAEEETPEDPFRFLSADAEDVCEEITGQAIELNVKDILAMMEQERKMAETGNAGGAPAKEDAEPEHAEEIPAEKSPSENAPGQPAENAAPAEETHVPAFAKSAFSEEKTYDNEETVPEEEETRDSDTDDDDDDELTEASDVSKKRKRRIPAGLIAVLCVLAAGALAFFLLYGNVRPWLRVELGTGLPAATDFVKDGTSASYVDAPEVSLTEEGHYLLTVDTVHGNRKTLLLVQDHAGPTAADAGAVISVDSRVSPTDAVRDVYDASDWYARWKSEPTQGVPGIYQGEVELIDSHGNTTLIPVTVRILAVKEVLEWELGKEPPTARDFAASSSISASFVTDLSSMEFDTVGDYPLELIADGQSYNSVLRIVDTVPPELETRPLNVITGYLPEPSEAVLSCTDRSPITFSYVEIPDISAAGTVTCTVVATDIAGNCTEKTTVFHVYDGVVCLEADAAPRTAGELLRLAELPVDEAGASAVVLPGGYIGSDEYRITTPSGTKLLSVTVLDTVAPTADAVPMYSYADYTHEPEEFITNLTDATEVSVAFTDEPDWTAAGDSTVRISLVDRAGNETVVETFMSLKKDTEAPALYGCRDFTCYEGSTVNYYEEVFAVDDVDPDVKLTADHSAVNVLECGSYEVVYTASDRSGNRTKKTVTLRVVERTVTDSDFDLLAESVLSGIITEDMSLSEKAYAVFRYCYDNISLDGESKYDDWRTEAYRGIKDGKGDSFTFYSASRFLLSRIDCRYLTVKHSGEDTNHFWLLVNTGSGWYHFDPYNGKDTLNTEIFMLTDRQLPAPPEEGDYSWDYDSSLYPQVESKNYSR